MRVAIYEPEPRICGPMTCAYQLQAGFQALGHDCDVLTFTKSGKPSITWGSMRQHIRWYRRAPDVVAKYADATSVLKGYDFTILTDVRTILQDKEALKGTGALSKDTPDYLAVLDKAGVEFTTAVHGNMYPPSEVQFASQLFSLPGFTGKAIAFSPKAPLASAHIWPSVVWLNSALPYNMLSEPDDDSTSPGGAIGITGRFIPNKGHGLLGLAGGLGLIKGDVELWGACSVGAGPSQSYRVFEFLTKELGLPGTRAGNEPDTVSGGDIIRPHPWEVDGPDGLISYKGGYEDPIIACWRLAVHCDLTAATFSSNMEFSQFESIDAGCGQVSVESMWNPEFTAEVIPAIQVISGEKKLSGTESGRAILGVVSDAVNKAKAKSTTTRRAEALHNRKVMSAVNSPATVAKNFLEAV
jgi:hypothetical protein